MISELVAPSSYTLNQQVDSCSWQEQEPPSQPGSAVWTGELFLGDQPPVFFFSPSNNIVSHLMPCNKSLSVQKISFFFSATDPNQSKGLKITIQLTK